MFAAVEYNLRRLATFRGRDGRATFWPVTAFALLLVVVVGLAFNVFEIMRMVQRMAEFANAVPERPAIAAGNEALSLAVFGERFNLVIEGGIVLDAITIVALPLAALLAASVVRRLHDAGRSGFWAILPVPFLVVASFFIGAFHEAVDSGPDFTLFVWSVANQFGLLIAVGCLAWMLNDEGVPDTRVV